MLQKWTLPHVIFWAGAVAKGPRVVLTGQRYSTEDRHITSFGALDQINKMLDLRTIILYGGRSITSINPLPLLHPQYPRPKKPFRSRLPNIKIHIHIFIPFHEICNALQRHLPHLPRHSTAVMQQYKRVTRPVSDHPVGYRFVRAPMRCDFASGFDENIEYVSPA